MSESFRGRIHRLRTGATQLEVWVADQQLEVIDGLALLADGAVYANNFASGKLYRVSVNADGNAGAVVPIETSMPLVRPDGLRTAGPRTLIQAEGQGRVTELTINGNRAEVRVIQENLPGATGVTIVGDSALVLVSRLKAVMVPYPEAHGLAALSTINRRPLSTHEGLHNLNPANNEADRHHTRRALPRLHAPGNGAGQSQSRHHEKC